MKTWWEQYIVFREDFENNYLSTFLCIQIISVELMSHQRCASVDPLIHQIDFKIQSNETKKPGSLGTHGSK